MVSRTLQMKRRPFVLQKYVAGDDFDQTNSGGYWETTARVAGSIKVRAGKEAVVGSQMTGLITSVIEVRNPCCPISSSDRLVRLDNGRVYNISGVVPVDEYERWLQLSVTQTDTVVKITQDGCDVCR